MTEVFQKSSFHLEAQILLLATKNITLFIFEKTFGKYLSLNNHS